MPKAKAENKKKAGAKGKYSEWILPDGIALIAGWARDGLTMDQIAAKMRITRTTLYTWRDQFPELLNALKKGKEVADFSVEDSLFKRACGIKTTERRKTFDENGNLVDEQVIERENPPDTTAAIFWLKNRKPDMWRDKPVPDKGNEIAESIERMAEALSKSVQNRGLPEDDKPEDETDEHSGTV